MKTKAKRILCIALALCICLTMLPIVAMPVAAVDPINMMIAYAQDRLGKTGSQLGYGNKAWCALFVSDCAASAGQSSAVPKNENAHDLYFRVREAGGTPVSSPQAGDLIFYNCPASDTTGDGISIMHVGLVAYDGYTIEGNRSGKAKKQKLTDSFSDEHDHSTTTGAVTRLYLRPAYDGVTVGPHTCDKGSYVFDEAAHPHYKCYRCSTCGQVWRNTAEPTIVDTCASCVPSKPTVSTAKSYYAAGSSVQISWNAVEGNTYYWINVYRDGTLIVNQSMANNTSYTLSTAEVGVYRVNVSANNSAGTSGSSSCSFSVVEDRKPTTPSISVSKTCCRAGDSITVSWQECSDAVSYIYYVAEHPASYAYETYVKSATIKENSVTFSDLPNGKYRIFVHAINALGKWSDQSNYVWMEFYNYDYTPTATAFLDGHMYVLYDGQMSWDLAQELCEMQNGYLVTITSEQENALVKSMIASGTGDGYWIGARNDNASDYTITNEDYRWITGEAFTHSDWAVGEPNSEGAGATLEHFAEIRKSIGNQWNDVKHTTKNGFILEIDVSEYSPVATAVYENSKYLLFDKNITWTEAKAYSESIGGHLAKISSAEEDAAISDLLQKGNRKWYYIGAEGSNGTWTWCDGSAVPMNGTTANWSNAEGTKVEGPSGWGNHLMKYRSSGNWIGIPNFYFPHSDMSKIGFVCEIDNAVFAVNYDANGGHEAPSGQTKILDEELMLSHTKPTRLGYTFVGWATDSSATVATYQPGDSFVGNSDITLYAVWEKGCEGNSHVYDYSVTTNPTTSIAGTLTGTCSKCKGTTTVTLPKLTTTDYIYAVKTAATCTADGTGIYTWKTTTYGSFSFNVALTKTGHSYSYAATKNPTTSATGTLTGTCSKCKETTTVTLPMLNTADYTYTVKAAATCTADGTATYTWKTTTYGDLSFDVTLAETGHRYDNGKITIAATCTQNGVKTYTCSGCGDTYTDSIVSTGHQYQYGVCITCGASDPNDSALSGTVASFGSSTDTVTMCIYEGNSNTALRTLTIKNGSFMIVGLPAGEYRLSFSKQNHVTREYTVTLEGGETVLDAKIYLIGDIDGNGKVNTGDVAKLNAHLKGTNQLTDEYAIKCANVNGGSLNMGDTAMLYAHIKGTKTLY